MVWILPGAFLILSAKPVDAYFLWERPRNQTKKTPPGVAQVNCRTLPDWDMIHKISRDRHNFRSLLVKIDNKIGNFKS